MVHELRLFAKYQKYFASASNYQIQGSTVDRSNFEKFLEQGTINSMSSVPSLECLKECLDSLRRLPLQQDTVKDLKFLIDELEQANEPAFQSSMPPSEDLASLVANHNIDVSNISSIVNNRSSAKNETKVISKKLSKALSIRDNLSWPKPAKKTKSGSDSNADFINVPLYTS